MHWIVKYQKGSFFLHETYDSRDIAAQRVLVLKEDETVWCVEIGDAVSGRARAVPRGSVEIRPVTMTTAKLSAAYRSD